MKCASLNENQKIVLICFCIHFLISLIWWAAFSPAIMSPDSLAQWGETKNLIFSDWHPYLSTVYFTFFSKVFNTPAAVAIFQIILTTIFFAYAFYFFLQQNVGKKIVIPVYFLLFFSIPVSLYNITIWKDVIFSLAIVIAAFLIAKKEYENKKWQKWELVSLMVFFIIATTFRHNGIVYVFFIPGLLWLYFKKQKWVKKFIVSYLLFICFFVFIAPKLISVKENPFWMTGKNLFAYHMSEALYVHPQQKITPHLRETLESVSLDKENLKKSYNKLYWNPLFWNDKINKDVLNSEIFWANLIPEFYLHNFIPNFIFISEQKFSAFFDITNGLGYEHGLLDDKNSDAVITVDENAQNIQTRPLLTKLNEKLGNYLLSFELNGLEEIIVWNAFVPILLLSILFIKGIIKRRSELQVFGAFILFQLPFLIYLNIAGDWRYFYFFYLSFFLTIPFLFLKRNISKVDVIS